MKLPLIGALAALTLSVATHTMAAESSTQDSVSGAPDSTLMTQTQKVQVDKKQHKQVQSDEDQRGRPAEQSKGATN